MRVKTGASAVASGWIVYRGRIGALADFASAFAVGVGQGHPEAALQEVNGGAFVIAMAVGAGFLTS